VISSRARFAAATGGAREAARPPSPVRVESVCVSIVGFPPLSLPDGPALRSLRRRLVVPELSEARTARHTGKFRAGFRAGALGWRGSRLGCQPVGLHARVNWPDTPPTVRQGRFLPAG